MNEWQMAMILASHTWPGTSISEGALTILNEVYGPHEHVGDGAECAQCGKVHGQEKTPVRGRTGV